MNPVRLMSALSVAATVALSFGSLEAIACSCAWQSLGMQLEQADYALVGTVIALEPEGDYVVATVAVSETFKGTAGPEIEISTHESSATCGYGFVPGEEVLLFASDAPTLPGDAHTSLCSRNSPVSSAASDLAILRGAPRSSYLPADVGNEWAYAYAPFEAEDQITVSVVETLPDGDRTYLALSGFPLPIDSLFLDALGNLGWMQSGSDQLLVDFTAETGMPYNVRIGAYEYEAKVERGGSVVVDAGRFDSTIRFTFKEVSGESEWAFTFAPEVGLVLITGSNGAWIGLTSAIVAGEVITAREPSREFETGLSISVFPDPVSDAATITIEAPDAVHLRVAVFDAAGRRIQQLADGPVGRGTSTIVWDAHNLAGGVYFVRVHGGGHDATAMVVRH